MCVKMMVDYACFSTSYSSPPIDSFFLARLFLYYVSGILGYFRGRGGWAFFPEGRTTASGGFLPVKRRRRRKGRELRRWDSKVKSV